MERFTNVFSYSDLKDYFSSLQKQLAIGNLPCSMVLGGAGHAISVGYDNDKHSWQFVDVEHLPVKYISDIDDLAQEVQRAFIKSVDLNSKIMFSTHIFSTKQNENTIKTCLQQWESTLEWKKLHTITPEKITFSTHQDRSLTLLSALHNDTKTLESLLKFGVDINETNKNGWTALASAASRSHIDVIKLLLQVKNINLNKVNEDSLSPLCLAAWGDHTEVIDLLLKQNANPNEIDKNGFTALYIAAEKGQTAILEKLLEHGSLVDQACLNGSTPLHSAVKNGHLDAVKLLLSRNANTQILCKGKSLLQIATSNIHRGKNFAQIEQCLVAASLSPYEVRSMDDVKKIFKNALENLSLSNNNLTLFSKFPKKQFLTSLEACQTLDEILEIKMHDYFDKNNLLKSYFAECIVKCLGYDSSKLESKNNFYINDMIYSENINAIRNLLVHDQFEPSQPLEVIDFRFDSD